MHHSRINHEIIFEILFKLLHLKLWYLGGLPINHHVWCVQIGQLVLRHSQICIFSFWNPLLRWFFNRRENWIFKFKCSWRKLIIFICIFINYDLSFFLNLRPFILIHNLWYGYLNLLRVLFFQGDFAIIYFQVAFI